MDWGFGLKAEMDRIKNIKYLQHSKNLYVLIIMKPTGVILEGSEALQHHSPLCLSTEKNSARGQVIDK